MFKCWMKSSTERPSFSEISEFLKSLLLNQEPTSFSIENAADYYSYSRDLTEDISVDYLSQNDQQGENDYITSPAYVEILPAEDCENSKEDLKTTGFPETGGDEEAAMVEPLSRESLNKCEQEVISPNGKNATTAENHSSFKKCSAEATVLLMEELKDLNTQTTDHTVLTNEDAEESLF